MAIKKDVPLHIFLEVGFSNSGSDLDNVIKPILDSLQDKYGINDKRIYKIIAEKKLVKKSKEYIKYDIYEM